MAHQTGFMYGLMMPIMLRCSAVLQDIWDAKKAIELIRAEGVTFTMASTPFLTDLAKGVGEGGLGVPTLRTFLCAGAPIPGPLVEHARKTLGAKIVSAWGMTENGAVTLIKIDDDDERAFNTSGCPVARRRDSRRRCRGQAVASTIRKAGSLCGAVPILAVICAGRI